MYERHTGVMLGLATRLLAPRAGRDGEDAVQEAWIRAVAALPRFAWRSSLRTWLCGFVVNCCREIARDSITMEENDVVAPRGGSAIDVERAISTLPPAAREVFVLHEIYGYTHEEIGAIAGIEPGTSKSQLHHARRLFRAYFEESHGRRTE